LFRQVELFRGAESAKIAAKVVAARDGEKFPLPVGDDCATKTAHRFLN
jgi:hypothetical protein